MSQFNFSYSVSIIQNIGYAANSNNSTPIYKILLYTSKVAHPSQRQ